MSLFEPDPSTPPTSLPITFNSKMPPPLYPGSDVPVPPLYLGYRASTSLRIAPPAPRPCALLSGFQSPALSFDSFFQSGNLDQVFRIDEYEYDLYMRSDTNTQGHTHWFYFSVSSALSKKTIKFNIVNFSRYSSLYKQGMQVRSYSVVRVGQGLSSGWQQSGAKVKFSPSKINSMVEHSPCTYYQLSFEYTLCHPDDKVWFATTIPYNYRRLQQLLKALTTDQDLCETSQVQVSVLTKSLGHWDVPLVTVANGDDTKKCILVVGRVHPSETVGSWVVEGFLRFICSKHPEAQHLRSRYTFKVVPMVNVDGVIAGNSRTSLSGKDLNRTYEDPDERLQPEICGIKRLAEGLRISIFIDVHGHFCKKGSFMYGPHFPLHSKHYFKSKIIPKLLSERSEIFRFYSSTFEEEKVKMGAARVVMANEFGVHNSYTLESSYFGYIDNGRTTHSFTIEDLCALGQKLARSIWEYSLMVKHEKSLMKNHAKIRRKQPPFEDRRLDNADTKVPAQKIDTVLYDRRPIVHRRLEDMIEQIRNEPSKNQLSDNEASSEEEGGRVLPPLEIKGVSTTRAFTKKHPHRSAARALKAANEEEAIQRRDFRAVSNYTITELYPAEKDTTATTYKAANFFKVKRVSRVQAPKRSMPDFPKKAVFDLYVPKHGGHLPAVSMNRRVLNRSL